MQLINLNGGAGVSAGINSLGQQFQSATSGWMNTADHIALQIFGALAVLEFVWSGASLLLRKNELNDMITGVLLKVVSLSFFFTLIIEAPTWVPDIIQSFWDIGGQIGGTPSPTPGSIFNLGVQMAAQVLTAAQQGSMLQEIANIIPAGLIALLIVLGMLILTLQLLMALIEAFIVVGAGAVLMGFLGSRWTSTWGEKYFGYAVSIGIKLMVVELITGLAFHLAGEWMSTLMAAGKGMFSAWPTLLGIGGGSIILGALSIMVPSIASSLMNGSPSLSLGNMGAAGAAIAGGTIAAGAGAAMGGISLANSAIGATKGVGALAGSANTAMGGMKGLGAAFQEGAAAANESGILGLGGAGASTGSKAAASTLGGLTGMAGLAASGVGTAGMRGLKAAGGMAKASFHGTSGRSAQGIAATLGDKAVQGHGETTAGGNFANRIRAQAKEDPKGNSVGLGAAPDAPGRTSGPVGGSESGGSGPSDPNAGASMGSTTTAGNKEGSAAAGIPGEHLGNTAAGIPNDGVAVRPNDGIQSKHGGDGFTGGGSGNNSLAGQGLGPRFDPRPDHEKTMDKLDEIKKRFAPGGINDGGGGGAGGPRISHTE